MQTTKTTLQRLLRALAAFDPSGTPFIGVQLRGESPLFYRSSPNGFIQSLGYNQRGSTVVVSLSHFQDCLGALQDERVDLSTDGNGTLRLQSVEAAFSDDLRVHTVPDTGHWAKLHLPGDSQDARFLDPGTFAGINIKPFNLVCPPVLRRGKLMLVTDHGIVMRSGMVEAGGIYPRDVFLRALAPELERLYVTQRGYWVAIAQGMVTVMAGHQVGDPLFATYDTPAAQEAQLPSSRILFALSKAAELAGPNAMVTLDSKGVTTHDQFQNRAAFGLGELPTFAPVKVTPKTAQTIVAALNQGKDEVVTLAASVGVRRFLRGEWEVNVKSFA